MRFMTETRIIWRPDDLHLIIYVLFNSPWPVWDRDTVMQVDVEMDEGHRNVTGGLRANPGGAGAGALGHHSRAPGPIHGSLRFIDQKHTAVEATMDLDPGGDLPHWLVRWFSRRHPPSGALAVAGADPEDSG